MSEILQLRLRHGYPGFTLDVDLALPGNGITAIYGRSGCGKTTLLRCLAGLEKAQHGRITIAGQCWQNEQTFLPTHRRSLGYVFQEPSLFDHLDVAANLDYALQRADAGTPVLSRTDIIELLGLEALLQRQPAQLSGGERQRVAIARALLVNPALLLMDEPLSALDTARRSELLPYLEQLHNEYGRPIIYVTHAADEILRLADHLVLLNNGQVDASGRLTDLLQRADDPLNLGDQSGVLLEARLAERSTDWHLMRLECGELSLWVSDNGLPLGQSIRLRILARDVSLSLSEAADSSIVNRLHARIVSITTVDASSARVQLDAHGQPLQAQVTHRSIDHLALQTGMTVWAQIKTLALLR